MYRFAVAALVLALAVARPAAADTSPPWLSGTAGIAGGQSTTHVLSRFVDTNSKVFLCVDTTAWPYSDLALPGLKVISHTAGQFTVSTLDGAPAPASGIPFNYVVFNGSPPAGSGYVVGSGHLNGNGYSGGASVPQATATSVVVLTADQSLQAKVPVSGLKVNNRGSGWFTVTTLDDAPLSGTGLDFNYLVVTPGAGAFAADRATLSANSYHFGKTVPQVFLPSTVLITVDAAQSPTDVSLPGIKVNNHGVGWFTASTADLSTNHPDLLFDYVVVPPPADWQEYGPTGLSANPWTLAAEPGSTWVQYAGSTGGGVWKTMNGGDSWSLAWKHVTGTPLALVGITRLAMAPDNPRWLAAIARDGQLWFTTDGAGGWATFGQRLPTTYDTAGRGVQLAVVSAGTVYACVRGPGTPAVGGLYLSRGGSWAAAGPAGLGDCSDVVVGRDGAIYAAFADGGVFSLPPGGTTWTLRKFLPPSVIGRDGKSRIPTTRLAAATSRLWVVTECQLSWHPLPFSDPTASWSLENYFQDGSVCWDTQSGYAAALAVSPASDGKIIVTANDAHLYDEALAGGPWFPPLTSQVTQLNVGQDDHQVLFASAQSVLMATDLGPRLSTDGGKTWTLDAVANKTTSPGPQTEEFYNFSLSLPDEFGRVFMGGAAQDQGGVFFAGRTTGFGCCTSESGLTAVARSPTVMPNGRGGYKTRFRVFGTDEVPDPAQGPGVYVRARLRACDVEVDGPDYLPRDPAVSDSIDAQLPASSHTLACDTGIVFGGAAGAPLLTITSIATGGDSSQALVGLENGAVYLATMLASAVSKTAVSPALDPPEAIRSVTFLSDSVALWTSDAGGIARVDLSVPSRTVNRYPSPRSSPALFAGKYGDASQAFVAYPDKLYWWQASAPKATADVTGPVLQAAIQQGMEIVGLARDTNHAALYVALGHSGWNAWSSRAAQVLRSPLQAGTNAPTGFTQVGNLPPGTPVNGLGLSPDRALYVSTQGRGILYLRDPAVLNAN